MTVKEAKKLVKQRLSEERFYHTKCVARAAKKLAPQFGADVEKAVLAAWLHENALVKSERYEEDGIHITAVVAKSALYRFVPFLGE